MHKTLILATFQDNFATAFLSRLRMLLNNELSDLFLLTFTELARQLILHQAHSFLQVHSIVLT